MVNDDEIVGRILSRREIMAIFGATGMAALLSGCSSGSSTTSTGTSGGTGSSTLVVTPAVTEGPFFVEEKINRSDLTSNSTRASVINGKPFTLNVTVQQVNGTTVTALTNAIVDVWHADGLGTYSDIASGRFRVKRRQDKPTFAVTRPPIQPAKVQFKTIYPGWYQGRAVHIHFKVRLYDANGNKTYEFTSQLFFDDTLSDTVLAVAPYNTRGTRQVRNATDNVYTTTTSGVENGPKLLLTIAQDATGYIGTFNVILQMS